MFPHIQHEVVRSAKAFTTSKIVVSFSLLAVLVAVGIPMIFSSIDRARTARAAEDVKLIGDAINAYQKTYSVYPIPLGFDQENHESNALLMNILSGDDLERNEKGISFFRGNVGNNESGRVYSIAGEFALYADPWGRAYRIKLDHDYDGNVEVPFNEEGTRETVICFSAGKDGDFLTPADNIVSW